MKKVSIAILLMLLVLFSVGSVQAYTNNKYGFSITPPTGWIVEEPSYAAVVFLGPIQEGSRVNVNIQVEGTTLTLEQYVAYSKQSLQTLQDFHLISESPRTINNVSAYQLVFTFTYLSVNVQEKQVYLVKDGKAFIITYAALPTTYQNYLTAFEDSVQTFQISSQPPPASADGTFLGLQWWIWVIFIAIIASIAAAAAVILHRKKPPPTQPPQPQIQTPPAP